MSQKLLEVITLGHCSHEFSWPRRAPDGDYYQVCLLCATQYKYDWKAMRRTEVVARLQQFYTGEISRMVPRRSACPVRILAKPTSASTTSFTTR